MRLPDYDKAIIRSEKLRDYILSGEHPEGMYKAVVFARLGYTRSNWEVLENDIRKQILLLPAIQGDKTKYGQKYTITGTLVGPSGFSITVVSVWIIRKNETMPRFITIYPREGINDH